MIGFEFDVATVHFDGGLDIGVDEFSDAGNHLSLVFAVGNLAHAFFLEGSHGFAKTFKNDRFVFGDIVFDEFFSADHLARMAGLVPPHQIVPFRGEFYNLVPEAEKLVRGLIYPVPDVNFPFLGVHLTKRIRGGVEAGPNAVLAFRREGYEHFDVHWGELMESLRYKGFHQLAKRHWRKGIDEMVRSFSKRAFLKSLQRLVPELKKGDIVRSRTGVRAQALDHHGNLVDDYVVMQQERMLHLLNAPSPAATSCLSIGEYMSNLFTDQFKNIR